jgi:hypothetical protein
VGTGRCPRCSRSFAGRRASTSQVPPPSLVGLRSYQSGSIWVARLAVVVGCPLRDSATYLKYTGKCFFVFLVLKAALTLLPLIFSPLCPISPHAFTSTVFRPLIPIYGTCSRNIFQIHWRFNVQPYCTYACLATLGSESVPRYSKTGWNASTHL